MNDRRTARRYGLALPVRFEGRDAAAAPAEDPVAHTREISRSGLYFTAEAAPEPGSMVTLTLTLPPTLTGGESVLVEVVAKIVRIEPAAENPDGRVGVAAKIERYEILRASSTAAN
jgi:hypothetical protein